MKNKIIAINAVTTWSGVEASESELRETLNAATAVAKRIMERHESNRDILYKELIPLLVEAIDDCLRSAKLRNYLFQFATVNGLNVRKGTDPATIVVRQVSRCDRQHARNYVGCCYELIFRKVAFSEIADTLRREGGVVGLATAYWKRQRKAQPAKVTRPRIHFTEGSIQKLSHMGQSDKRVFFSAVRHDTGWLIERVTRSAKKLLE